MASYRKLPPTDDNQSEIDQSEADDQSEAAGPRGNGVAENPSEMKAILSELREVAVELKAINKTARELRLRKKELEASVINFLEKTEQPGLKFGDVVFMSKDKKKRAYKKKADKIADASAILEKYGIKNPAQVLEEVLEANRGAVSQVSALKIQEAVQYKDL